MLILNVKVIEKQCVRLVLLFVHTTGAFFSIYLVDTVTGNLVFHCTHKKSKGPINLIHSENWVSVSLNIRDTGEGWIDNTDGGGRGESVMV